MNLSVFPLVFGFLFLVRNAEGCLVVNPRSTTVSTTEVTSTVATTSGSTKSTASQSTVSQSTGSTVSSGSTQSTQSTVSQSSQSTVSTDTTVTHSTQSTFSQGSIDQDFTTTISQGTTQEDCKAYCNNPDNILIPENTHFEKPSTLKLPNENDDICGTYMVSCDAPGGQYCDRINLIASQTGTYNLIQLAEQDQVSVRGFVVCSGNGVFRPDGASEADAGFYDMTCMYTNCRNGTVPEPTTPEPTTVSSTAGTTTEAKSCSTCDIQKLFNYANRTDKFQPWYHDISNEDNCMCKALDISCELYGVDTCDSHQIRVLTEDVGVFIMIDVRTNKVNGEIYCQDNGEYGVYDPAFEKFVNIKEIYCISENCRNSTAVVTTSTPVTTSTVEPTTTEVRNCKTCQAPSLFNYSGEEYFQPWYQDVDGGNCNCKINEFSCEVYGNVSCNWTMEYRDTNGDVFTLVEVHGRGVGAVVDCADSGYWEVDGNQLAQIYCTKNNCL